MSDSSSPDFVSTPSASGIERRVSTRYSANLATSCRIKASLGNGASTARVRNISAGGVSLVVSHPVDAGAIVPVELKSTLRNFARTVELRVLYCVEHPGGDWILGGEFVHPFGEEELRNYLVWRDGRPSEPNP